MCHGWLNSDDAHRAFSTEIQRRIGYIYSHDRAIWSSTIGRQMFQGHFHPFALSLIYTSSSDFVCTKLSRHIYTKSYKINTQHAEAPMNPQPFHHQCFVGDSLVHLPFVTAYTSLYVYMYNYIYIYIWLYMFTWVVLEVCSKHGIESTGSSSFTGFHIMQSH